MIDPNEFVITRKRKKYKFALFANSPRCFEHDEWRNRPATILEVGAGTGYFGVSLARLYPGEEVVAIDVKADRLIKGAQRADNEAVHNVAFLRTRADLLHELFAPRSIKQLWVTFPDPFPKARSSGRRLTHPTFLRQYATLLAADGALYFKTDAKELFEWSLEQLVAEKWTLQELSFDLHESTFRDEYKVETVYEARFRQQGIAINFVKAQPPRVLGG